jgi:hypothetical protein
MKTVRLFDFSPYNRNKGKTQELRHKFRNQNGWLMDRQYVKVYNYQNIIR